MVFLAAHVRSRMAWQECQGYFTGISRIDVTVTSVLAIMLTMMSFKLI